MGICNSAPRKCHDSKYCVSSLPKELQNEAAQHLCDIFCAISDEDSIHSTKNAIQCRGAENKKVKTAPIAFDDYGKHREVFGLVARLCSRVYRCSCDVTTANLVIDLLIQMSWNFGWNVSGQRHSLDPDILASLLRTNRNLSKRHFSIFERQLILRHKELGIVFRPIHFYLTIAGSFKHDGMIREILSFVSTADLSALCEKDFYTYKNVFDGVNWSPFLIWNVARLQLMLIDQIINGHHLHDFTPEFESDPCAPFFERHVGHLLFGLPDYDNLNVDSRNKHNPRVIRYKSLLRDRVLKCQHARAKYLLNAGECVSERLSNIHDLGKMVVSYLPV